MTAFNPEKLTVTYFGNVSQVMPIIPRYYTLTHSDLTGELFLDIGSSYRWDKIDTKMRDEVLGYWHKSCSGLAFHAFVYVSGGEFNEAQSLLRYRIFQRELPLALKAIRYGDRALFEKYPALDDMPIFISFQSIYPQFNNVQYWGTFKDYRS